MIAIKNLIHRRTVVILLSVGILASTIWGIAHAADELIQKNRRHKTKGAAFQLKKFRVVGGTEQAAKIYYREKVSKHLAFLKPETIEASSIKDLLEYFGYPKLTAVDLHQLSSDKLMAKSEKGDILGTRFFAPKISEVSEKPVSLSVGGFGWRKLVRLKAKKDSPAEKNGMEMLYFLQNVFETTGTGDPFDPDKTVSNFNQAIVTRKGPGPFTEEKHPLYFLTYGPLVKLNALGQPDKVKGNFQDDGDLILSLRATFDEGDRDPETNLGPNDYYVPDSCIQCHGGSKLKTKVNYLDSDHWFDRVTPDYGLTDAKFKVEDFTALDKLTHGILYDGGKDRTTNQFKDSFGIVRSLNEEIKQQNTTVGGTNNFQLGAVTKWLDLHAGKEGSKHVPPPERGFGTQVWDKNDEKHKKILYYLNRYCYRCHSSVKYNVFDKQAVVNRIGDIEDRLLDISSPDRWMPQDRIFPGLTVHEGVATPTGDLKEFLDLLKSLQP